MIKKHAEHLNAIMEALDAKNRNKILTAMCMLNYLVTDEPQNYSQINKWARRVVELSEEILTEELEQELMQDG
jgi:hypothetical protein